MKKVLPVILCGGVGSRLWPVSRKNLPKQFFNFDGDFSLFQKTVMRLDVEGFLAPLVITAEENKFLVQGQLRDLGVQAQVVVEPEGKNTAPAVLLAALMASNIDPKSIVVVQPSDHEIPNSTEFIETLRGAIDEIEKGYVLVFGIKPDRAETGYGYIEVSEFGIASVSNVLSFKEKPDIELAKKFVESKNHFWNSGILLFRSVDMLSLATALKGEMLEKVSLALENGSIVEDVFILNELNWRSLESISVDYAILENAKKLRCIELKTDWSDMGDWGAVSKKYAFDDTNNALGGACTIVKSKNSGLLNYSRNAHLVGVGIDNIIAVVCDDAVLVINKNALQDVREVIPILERKTVSQANFHALEHRPWGSFEVLLSEPFYKTKRLIINAKSKISLQSHKHRSENWVVVSGTATVTIDGKVKNLNVNDSIFIRAGQVHRLSNETEGLLVVIEVQTGSYLEEDDICRYEDDYGRG